MRRCPLLPLGHSSIGASTRHLGLVGVLAGLAAWRRHRLATRRRGAWVALGAGLAIVAMLGGAGPRSIYAARLFGLVAGSLAGVALAYPLAAAPPPAPSPRRWPSRCSVLLIALAWHRAWA